MKETINKIKATLEEAYQEHNRLDSVFAVIQQRIGTWEREIEFIQRHPEYTASESVAKLKEHIDDETELNSEIVEKIYSLEDLINSLETACCFAELLEEKYVED